MLSAFRSGIMIVTAIQLFNWFPTKYYGTILSLCLLMSPVAFMMQFVVGGFYKCFPDMPYFYFNNEQFAAVANNASASYPGSLPGEWCGFEPYMSQPFSNYSSLPHYTNTTDPIITGWSQPSTTTGGGDGGVYFYNSGFDRVSMWRHFGLGFALAILSVIDIYTFSYFPIEKRLFVRQEERSIEEQAIIRDSEGEFYRDNFKRQKSITGEWFQISYMHVLKIREVQLMIIAGGLK